MIRAKVLSDLFSRYVGYKKVDRFRKCSDVAFTFRNYKVKLYSTVIDMAELCEPPNVKGMKILDKKAFEKNVTVTCLIVENETVNLVLRHIKKFVLKVRHLKSVQKTTDDKQKILMNPKVISSWNDFDEGIKNKLKELGITENNLHQVPIQVGYDNWTADALLKAVLPNDNLMLRSYSLVGHIIHLNIKSDLLDYKHIIAEILLDKVPNAKTVIYKKNVIQNVYRNFEMEILKGEPNFIATVIENGCKFELDFSKVYWNPRLSTEHHRIVKSVNFGDVLFDVFAGVGPFAIPAAKKKCHVFANDLNPESIKWLKQNITLNKKVKDYITYYNKDGKDFILEDVRENILKFWKDDLFCGKIHVVMNLPAIAPTFMKYFKSLITKNNLVGLDIDKVKNSLPIINCYFFIRNEECGKMVFERVAEMTLNDIKHSLHFVRNISGSGSMIRITFSLPFEYLVKETSSSETDEPLPKRICTN